MAYQFDNADFLPDGVRGRIKAIKAVAQGGDLPTWLHAALAVGTMLPGAGNTSWAALDAHNYKRGQREVDAIHNTAGRNKPSRQGVPAGPLAVGVAMAGQNPVSAKPAQKQSRGRKALEATVKAAKILKYVNTMGWPASIVLHALKMAGKYPFTPGEEYLQAKAMKEKLTGVKDDKSPWLTAPYLFAEPPPPPKWWLGPRQTHQAGPGEKPPKYPPRHRKQWTDAHSLRWFALNAKGNSRDDVEEAEFSELNSHPDNWHRQVQDEFMRNIHRFGDDATQFALDPGTLSDLWQMIQGHPKAVGLGVAGLYSVYRIVRDAMQAAHEEEITSRKQSANEWSPNSLPRPRRDNNNPYNAGRPRRAASQDVYGQLVRRAGAMT